MPERKRIIIDVVMGDLPKSDVSDRTFTPAREETYLGLLVDLGHLTLDEYNEHFEPKATREEHSPLDTHPQEASTDQIA